MKRGHYFFLLSLAAASAVFAVTLILLAHANQRLQGKLQARQQVLGQGIMGQQAQQISGGVLYDMAQAGVSNAAIRRLLEKHGYDVASPKPLDPVAGLPEPQKRAPVNSKELIP